MLGEEVKRTCDSLPGGDLGKLGDGKVKLWRCLVGGVAGGPEWWKGTSFRIPSKESRTRVFLVARGETSHGHSEAV
jgi:hypothetical protein